MVLSAADIALVRVGVVDCKGGAAGTVHCQIASATILSMASEIIVYGHIIAMTGSLERTGVMHFDFI